MVCLPALMVHTSNFLKPTLLAAICKYTLSGTMQSIFETPSEKVILALIFFFALSALKTCCSTT